MCIVGAVAKLWDYKGFDSFISRENISTNYRELFNTLFIYLLLEHVALIVREICLVLQGLFTYINFT